MSLHFTFRKMEATEAIKTYVEKKIKKIDKYISYPVETHVLLSVIKTVHTAEITLHAEHKPMVATAKSDDLYESIDAAVSKIETQLKKEREKKKGHQAAHKMASPHAEKYGTDVMDEVPHRGKKRNGKVEA